MKHQEHIDRIRKLRELCQALDRMTNEPLFHTDEDRKNVIAEGMETLRQEAKRFREEDECISESNKEVLKTLDGATLG